MSNSKFRTTQTDLNEHNPFHPSMNPHPHDHPSQLLSPPLTANSFIGTAPPEDKPDHVFRLLCSNPNGFNLGAREGDFIDYCKEVYRFQADTCNFIYECPFGELFVGARCAEIELK